MGFGAVGIWDCFWLRGFKVPEVTPTSQYEDPVVVAVVKTVRSIVSLSLSRGLRFLSYPRYSGWAFPTPAGHSQSNTVFPNLHDSSPLANRVPVKCRAPQEPHSCKVLAQKAPIQTESSLIKCSWILPTTPFYCRRFALTWLSTTLS